MARVGEDGRVKPPICAICGERFGPEEGGLVAFAMRPSDLEWRERMEATGAKGHPPWMVWFCGAHVEAARLLRDLTADAAFARLRGREPGAF